MAEAAVLRHRLSTNPPTLSQRALNRCASSRLRVVR